MNDVKAVQAVLDPIFPGLMGVKLVSVSEDKVVAEMKVRSDLCTTGGICHGGAYMAFGDTLGAVGTFMSLPKGARTTTTDSSTKFIAGSKEGSVITGESVAMHRGRTTHVWQTTIRREDGKLCAVVTQTQLIIPA
jgi:1,4-dihydroxy-2-naphthoyl-CoA hydrolase